MAINQPISINKYIQLIGQILCQSLLGGCLSISAQATPLNNPVVIAQSVIDGLPPPPNVQQINFPSQPKKTPSSNSTFKLREFNFQAPRTKTPKIIPKQNHNTYRVYINGDNRGLLQQIRYVEPEAFVRPGEGVIQAGTYVDKSYAQQRVRELEGQGINAQITTIAPGATYSPKKDTPKSYFVIIPGDKADLPTISAKVISLNINPQSVRIRNNPIAPHIAVGPFQERTEADRWNSYLRFYKMDARVYFGH